MKFQDLLAYKKSVDAAMNIFEISKAFPKEEIYSLTDQIRRSFRSVSANIAESYRKRIYPKLYTSKLTDSDAENSEIQVWLEYAWRCKYLSDELYKKLIQDSEEIGKLLNYMVLHPEKFGVKKE